MRRRIPAILWLALAGVSLAGDGPKSPPAQEPELRLELLRLAKVDQDARGAITSWMVRFGNNDFVDEKAFEASLDATRKAEYRRFGDAMRRIDGENTKRPGEIVDRHGWPTSTIVGKDGAIAARLLVQHAGLSPKFQRECLDLMARVPRDEVRPSDLAYLTDRVLLPEGKEPRYGTQSPTANGICKPRPPEDEADVDRRRKEVGLPPLAEYLEDAEACSGGGSRK